MVHKTNMNGMNDNSAGMSSDSSDRSNEPTELSNDSSFNVSELSEITNGSSDKSIDEINSIEEYYQLDPILSPIPERSREDGK